eukprot:UN00248
MVFKQELKHIPEQTQITVKQEVTNLGRLDIATLQKVPLYRYNEAISSTIQSWKTYR